MAFIKQKRKKMSLARQEMKWGFIFISPWIVGFLLFYFLPMLVSLVFSFHRINLGDQTIVGQALLTPQTFEKLREAELPDDTLLDTLQLLQDTVFHSQRSLFSAIEDHLGRELWDEEKRSVWDSVTKKSFVGFENWKQLLFNDPEIWPSVRKIFHFGLITVPLSLGFALFLAILLNSKHLFGTNVFRTLFYMPFMIPLVAAVLIWRGVLDESTGWINIILERVFGIKALGIEGIRWLHDPDLIYFAYAMIGLWAVGNAMLIFLAGLQQVPTELYEAAYVDGAGWWTRLFRITLPMISPVFFYNLVVGLIVLLQYFLVPYVLVNPNAGAAAYPGYPDGATNFIMVYFYLQSFSFLKMGYGAAIAWVMFVIALLMTIVLFATARYWVYYAGEKQ